MKRRSGIKRHRPGVYGLAILSFIVVVVLSSCSSSEGEAGAEARQTASTANQNQRGDNLDDGSSDSEDDESVSERAVDLDALTFSGTEDAFYDVPDPLPSGRAGELLRVMEQVSDDPSRTAWRIMYLSEDGAGRPRAVTGIVTLPTEDAHELPVVAWAHGTTGLAPQCAPSRDGHRLPAFDVEGVFVGSDYIGLGPNGERHAYMSRLSEGHSVIDSVRAARSLAHAEGLATSTDWVLAGHSQGGHAAQAAHELAPDYSPELNLVGTVSSAPAAVFLETFEGIDPIVASVVAVMGIYGIATENPDIDPHDYVKQAMIAVESVFDDHCLDRIPEVVLTATDLAIFENDPVNTEPARSELIANDVGYVATEAPLLLMDGTADVTVFPSRVSALFERLCDSGQVTEHRSIADATHGNMMELTLAEVSAWMRARLAGEPPLNSCPR